MTTADEVLNVGEVRARTDAHLEARMQLLEVDDKFADSFARRPMGVQHTLAQDSLLSLEAIAELADSLPLDDVERHQADLPLLMPGGAPDLEGRPSDTVLGIESNGCWMVLWYIEQVPAYKALLDGVLADAEAYISQSGPDREWAMSPRRREAFLFLSAPNALTPVHFDPEQNFLLQIKGHKEMHVCDFPDELSRRRELERYYGGGHRNLEAVPPGRPTTFHMTPGDGVYVPPFFPHWVKNGPEASISLSITFRTRASERFERVQQLNAKLRRLNLSPRHAGESERADRAKEAAHLVLSECKKRAGKLRGLRQRRGDLNWPA